MHVTAHRPQEVLRLGENLENPCREHLLLAQLRQRVQAVLIFRDPVERVQIAQSALALFHIGLDEIARLPGLAMADITLFEFRSDEFRSRFADDVAYRNVRSTHHTSARSPHKIPRLEQRCADRHIVPAETDAVVDRPGGVADFVAHVPEHVEHVFDNALAQRSLLVGQQEQQIEIGAGGERAAPVTTPTATMLMRSPADRLEASHHMGDREIVEAADDLVLQVRQPLRAQAVPEPSSEQHRLSGMRRPLALVSLQQCERRHAHFAVASIAAAIRRQTGQRLPQGVGVDDFVELGVGLFHHE